MLIATKEGVRYEASAFDFGDGPVEFFLNSLVEGAMQSYVPSLGDPSAYVASVVDGEFGVSMHSTNPVHDEIVFDDRVMAPVMKSVTVKPYTKKDGTKVSGYDRSGNAASDSAEPPSKKNPGGVEFKPAEGKTDVDFVVEQYDKALEKHGEAFIESVVREWDSDKRTAVRLQVASMLETALGNADKLGFSGGLTKDALKDAKTALLDDTEAIGVVKKLGLPDVVELARDLPSVFDTDEFLRDNEEWNWLKPDDIDEARAVRVMLNALESGSLYDAMDKEVDTFVSDYVKKFGDGEISQLDRKKMDAWNNAVYAVRGMEEIGIGDSALAASFDKAIADIIPSLDPISAETLADKVRSMYFGAGSESQDALSKLHRKEIEAAIESLDIDHLESEYSKAQELSSYAYEGKLAKAITAARTKIYEKESLGNATTTKQQQIENDQRLKDQYQDAKPRVQEIASEQISSETARKDLSEDQRDAAELGFTSPDFVLNEAAKELGVDAKDLPSQFEFRGHLYDKKRLQSISSANEVYVRDALMFGLPRAKFDESGNLIGLPTAIDASGNNAVTAAEQLGFDMGLVRKVVKLREETKDGPGSSEDSDEYFREYREARKELRDAIDGLLENTDDPNFRRLNESIAAKSWSANRLDEDIRRKETGLIARTDFNPDNISLYDPTVGDYKGTQKLAKHIQSTRTKDLIQEKVDSGELPADLDVERAAKEIEDLAWSEWKSSSTTTVGKAMQLAAVEEFGALGKPEYSANREEIIERTGEMKYELIKSHLRATWEATQYLLEQAGQDKVTMWRGLMLDETQLPEPEVVDGQFRLPDLQLLRNGLSSATTDPGVANGWGGIANSMPANARRVVLRIEAGAEDILTLPIYGDNIHSEQEVIPLGSRWNRWDAWLNRAPSDPEASWKQETIAKSILVDLQDKNTIVLDHEGEPNWLTVYGEAQDAIDESYDELVEAAERESDPELKSAILGISSILKTQVKPYTKKDGTRVGGYTREGSAAPEEFKPTGSAAIQIESKRPGNQQTAAVSRTKYNQLAQELSSLNMQPSLDDKGKDRASKIEAEMAELFTLIEDYHSAYTKFESSAFRVERDNNKKLLDQTANKIDEIMHGSSSEIEEQAELNARESVLEHLAGFGDFPLEEGKRKKQAIQDILRLASDIAGFDEEDAKRIFLDHGENAGGVHVVGDMIYALRDAYDDSDEDYDSITEDIKELQKEYLEAEGESRNVMIDKEGNVVGSVVSGSLEEESKKLNSLPTPDLNDPDWKEKAKAINAAKSKVERLLLRDAHLASMEVAGRKYDNGADREDAIRDSIKSEISRLQEEYGTDLLVSNSRIYHAADRAWRGNRPSVIEVSKEDMKAEISDQINELKQQRSDIQVLELISDALDPSSGSELWETLSSWEEMYEDPEETLDYDNLYEEAYSSALGELEANSHGHVDSHSGSIDAPDEVRGQFKQDVVDDVSSILSDKASREDISYTSKKVFGYGSATFDSSTELSQQALNTWAASSSNSTLGSLTLQEAVRMRFGEMFGMEGTVGDKETLAKAQELLQDPVIAKTMQALVDSIYENTQEKLGELDGENYSLFRGMSWGEDNVPPQLKNVLSDGLFGDDHLDQIGNAKGKLINTPVEQNPISSYSTDPYTARSFASGRMDYRALLLAIVPKERIFSTFGTGPGCLTEAEFTVLGGDPPASKLWVQKGAGIIPSVDAILNHSE